MVNHTVQAQAIKNAIEHSQTILLVGHKKPDADTLGSVCAWINLLKGKGKDVSAFCLDPVPDYLQHLPGSQLIAQNTSVFEKVFDLIIVNDAGSLDYAGIDTFVASRDKERTVLINIDHHATNPHYGDINLVIADAGSATEVLSRLFIHWGETLHKPIAECLLNGLITDTDSLTNPAASHNSFAIAATLVNAGADIHDIIHRTLKRKSITDLKLWGLAMSRLRHNKNYNIVASYLTQEDVLAMNASDESVEGIINYLTLIPNVSVIVFMKPQSNGTIKGSFRTVKDSIDVSKLALLLGGGGHKKASGFSMQGTLQVTGNDWTII